MAHTQREALLRYLTHMVSASALAEESDRQLLDRFIRQREDAAFAALLRRHAGMVWHVCRRVLGHVQDAEDVFQATFLLLARKASSIRKREAVASWLYGVAHRLSLRARVQSDRRQARERQVSAMTRKEPAVEAAWRELQALLDEELHRLPEKYRAPLVLCYLEDKTHEQAAAQLGWPLGTVRGRVARARELLRSRLARRGLALSAQALGTALAANVALAVPPRLLDPTLQAALQFAGGQVAAAALVSSKVAALVEGGLQAMFLSKLKAMVALVAAVGMLASGAGALSQLAPGQTEAGAQGEELRQAQKTFRSETPPAAARLDLAEVQVAQAEAQLAVAKRQLELLQAGSGSGGSSSRETLRPGPSGDTLPPGALARLGNDRLAQTGSFYCLAFAPDGKGMACAQMDSTLRLLEVPSGKELRRLGQPQTPDTAKRNYWVSQMAFSADGKLLASLKPTGDVTVWRTDSGEELCRLTLDLKYEAAALAFSPDGKLLATGGKEQPPRLWDVTTGKELRSLTGHTGPVPCVAFVPDGTKVATGGEDQTVRLWDAATGKELAVFAGHRNVVHALGFAPDGTKLASAAVDRTVRVWEAATGKELHRLDASRGPVMAGTPEGVIVFVSFSADGRTVALGRSDRTVRFWEAGSGVELARFDGPSGAPTNVALSPDGKVVAMGNVNGRLHLWDRITGKELAAAEGHQHPVLALAFSPDGKLLATGSADRTIRLWDAVSGRERCEIQGHSGEVSALAFAPDGKLLASVSRDPNDRTLSLWDVTTGKEVRQIRFNAMPSGAPRSRAVALGEAAVGQLALPPSTPMYSVVSLAFLGAGRELALLDAAGNLFVYETASGKSLRTVNARGAASVSFAPDGKTFAVSGPDGVLRLFDIGTGQEVRTFDARTPGGRRTGAAQSVAFSPDGRTLLSTGSDSRLSLWDAATGHLIRQLDQGEARAAGNAVPGAPVLPPFGGAGGGGTSPYYARGSRPAAFFSPDGRMLAVYGRNNSVRLLETATGSERCRFQGHQAEITAIGFSPDGKLLATASVDSTILLWDVTLRGKAELSDEEFKARWDDLLQTDGATSYQGVQALAAAPKQATPFLREQLKPASPADTDRIPQLIADLDSTDFATRKKAVEELEKLGNLARPALLKTLAAKPSLEVTKRIEGLLKNGENQVPTGEALRQLRAVEVLEYIGTPEARAVLERLAKGGAEAPTTIDAAAALERLSKRNPD